MGFHGIVTYGMKKLAALIMLVMILGVPFSIAGAKIDRLALTDFPLAEDTATKNVTATNTVLPYESLLSSVPYTGFQALRLRSMYLLGQYDALWNECESGANNSSITSVRFYCYDVAWTYDREVAIQIGSANRFYYYDLYVYSQNPRNYLTRVMLTAWRNGQVMRQAAALARSLNLQDVANLYNHTTQSAAY